MRILLSNDDGILAPGLAALYAAVADIGQVQVVAPESPQSAAGHSITLADPLCVRTVHVGGPEGLTGISVDGRPADCVRLAIKKLLDTPPDLVLSGINAGANVGINVFYSGTVAAAAEAAMCGIPAVAFSAALSGFGQDARAEVDFPRIGCLCRWVLSRLLEQGLTGRDLINVNVPVLEADAGIPRGVRVVRQSTAGLADVYHHHVDHNGQETYRLGDEYGFVEAGRESDVTSLAEGFITVTPLHVDMTDHRRLERLRTCAADEPPA